MIERLYIGTAGWSIPRAAATRFVGEGTHLQRYAGVLRCAEINSSFHRPHRMLTYARWAAATPPDFRFAVKVPRAITHDLQLRRARVPLERFLDETAGLQQKRGPLLVQLPPSFAFDARVAAKFFAVMRASYDSLLVCEPRHPTWFSPQADALLVRFQVGRVAADPAPVAGGDCPGGWSGVVYFRLHGSPRKYWSSYDSGQIAALAESLSQVPTAVSAWCVFDNTASGAAIENAWELQSQVARNRAMMVRPSGRRLRTSC